MFRVLFPPVLAGASLILAWFCLATGHTLAFHVFAGVATGALLTLLASYP